MDAVTLAQRLVEDPAFATFAVSRPATFRRQLEVDAELLHRAAALLEFCLGRRADAARAALFALLAVNGSEDR
jgi:hypothetical protein